jgi:hypothetical protein
VVVRAEGQEVARKAAVTSQLLLGYADSVDVPVERGQVCESIPEQKTKTRLLACFPLFGGTT